MRTDIKYTLLVKWHQAGRMTEVMWENAIARGWISAEEKAEIIK